MSTDNATNTTIAEQTDKDAAKLRACNDTIDAVARENGGTVDDVLRDVQHIIETTAAVLEQEDGEITPEEFQELVYPTGGPR